MKLKSVLFLLLLLMLKPASAFGDFRSKTWTSGTGTSVTPTEPAGAAENDILWMQVVIQEDEGTVVDPTGWTKLYDVDESGSFNHILYWIRRTGSAPSFAVSWTNSRYYEFSVTAWSNIITTGNPYDVGANGSIQNRTPANPDCDPVTTTVSPTEVIAFGASWTGATTVYGAPSGYTIREAGSAGTAICIASKVVTAIGEEDPGAFTGVDGGAANTGEFTVALKLLSSKGPLFRRLYDLLNGSLLNGTFVRTLLHA